jgi:hypothetical protein
MKDGVLRLRIASDRHTIHQTAARHSLTPLAIVCSSPPDPSLRLEPPRGVWF